MLLFDLLYVTVLYNLSLTENILFCNIGSKDMEYIFSSIDEYSRDFNQNVFLRKDLSYESIG